MTEASAYDGEEALHQLRVLTLTSGGVAAKRDYVYEPLNAAKKAWNWHVSVVCKKLDSADYQAMAAPHGTLHAEPATVHETVSWESDRSLVAAVDAKIQEAERLTGVPVGQVVLAADSRIGRAFAAPVINLPLSPDSPRIYETNNLEPFRAIRRLFHWADNLLEKTKPDVIYTHEWAKPWMFVIWLAAQRLGIPCIAVRRSKIRSGANFFTTDPMMFNVAARSLANDFRQVSEAINAAGSDYLGAFRDKPRVLQHIQTKWENKSRETWQAWHRNWVRSVARKAARRVSGGKTGDASDLRRLIDFNQRELSRRRHRKLLRTFDDSELKSLRYVFYPMHKETDLPLSFQAAAWFDQRNTVRLLASSLPNGCHLLVREHRRNYGLRPDAYYEELAMLPNVFLVDALDSQFKYVQNADLIVTENGSSGWEGLVFGRPVLALSQTFYDGAGRARKLESRDTLPRTVLEMLSTDSPVDQDAHDRDLACMVQAEYDTTFSEKDMTTALHQLRSILVPLMRQPQPTRQMEPV